MSSFEDVAWVYSRVRDLRSGGLFGLIVHILYWDVFGFGFLAEGCRVVPTSVLYVPLIFFVLATRLALVREPVDQFHVILHCSMSIHGALPALQGSAPKVFSCRVVARRNTRSCGKP